MSSLGKSERCFRHSKRSMKLMSNEMDTSTCIQRNGARHGPNLPAMNIQYLCSLSRYQHSIVR